MVDKHWPEGEWSGGLRLCYCGFKIVPQQTDWFGHSLLILMYTLSPASQKGHPWHASNAVLASSSSWAHSLETNVLEVSEFFPQLWFLSPFVLPSQSPRHFCVGCGCTLMGFFSMPGHCSLSERKGFKNSMACLLNSQSCLERLFPPFECLIMILLLDAQCIKGVRALKHLNHFKIIHFRTLSWDTVGFY